MKKALVAAAAFVVLVCSVLVAQESSTPYSFSFNYSMTPKGDVTTSTTKFENPYVVITASELVFDRVTNEIKASGDVKIVLKK